MNINIINIKWSVIAENLLPYFWRDISLFREGASYPAWLKEYVNSILTPLQPLTNNLFEVAFDIETWLQYNGQVTVLEACLNRYFDSVENRIFISDDFSLLSGYVTLYEQHEVNPEPIDLYLATEVNPSPITLSKFTELAGEVDFYINVPAVLSFNQPELEQIVSRYAGAGMRFTIQTF